MAPQLLATMIDDKKSSDNTSLTNYHPPMMTSRTCPTSYDLIKRFGATPENLLTLFAPTFQTKYCRDVERVHFGKAPKIKSVAEAYGHKTAESWLEIQLNDLSEFVGCKDKLTKRQIEETALMILETYPNYNLVEFMLFFHRFKMCRYGRFYGMVDPMIILQALSTFNDERESAYIEHRRKEQERERQESDRQFNAEKQQYISRVPDAFTDKAPIDFNQYRLMGFATMSDEQLQQEIADIRAGRKVLPTDVMNILNIFNEQ